MKTAPLKLGFIGGGIDSAIGTTHFIASQMDKRFEVVAGCFSQSDAINKESGLQRNIAPNRIYVNYQELLNQEKGLLDAVVILTPTPKHPAHIVDALKENYPVICEKALATSTAEINLIKNALQQYQGFLAVTYNYSGYPMLRELRNMIKKGELGKIQQLHIEMPQEGFLRLGKNGQPITPQGWRLKDQSIPTLYLDLFVHLHNIIYFLTNEHPLEVIATNRSFGNFPQITDNTSCIANYTNDLQCNIWFSKSALGYRNGLKVRAFGNKASAEWHQMEPENLTINSNYGEKTLIDRASSNLEIANQARYSRFKPGHPAGFIEAFANYYSDIADNLHLYMSTGTKKNQDYVFGIDHAEEGITMCESLVESSSEKFWKSVPN